jgi:hypothetical protein
MAHAFELAKNCRNLAMVGFISERAVMMSIIPCSTRNSAR